MRFVAYHENVVFTPADHQAPTTGIRPDELARWYGYDSLRSLVKDLPRGGRVLDLGAGISLFGEELSRYRRLHVVALDRRYRHPALSKALVENRPKRSHHVAADATRLPFRLESFDAVFSSLLFLDFYDKERALTAARAVFDVLKVGGFAKVGPNQPRIDPKYRLDHGIPLTFTAVKDGSIEREVFAAGIVRATRLSAIGQGAERRSLNPRNDEVTTAEIYANRLRQFRLQNAGGHDLPGWIAPARRDANAGFRRRTG